MCFMCIMCISDIFTAYVLRYVAMCIQRNVLIHAHWDIKVCVKVLGNVSACVLDYVLLHVYGYYILLHHVCMCICIGKWYEEKFLNLTKN